MVVVAVVVVNMIRIRMMMVVDSEDDYSHVCFTIKSPKLLLNIIHNLSRTNINLIGCCSSLALAKTQYLVELSNGVTQLQNGQ